MSEGETAVDKDILAELDREASDYLKVRLFPTSSLHLPPLFCFSPPPEKEKVREGKKGKERKRFKIIRMIMIMGDHRLMRSPLIRMPKYIVLSTLLPTSAL